MQQPIPGCHLIANRVESIKLRCSDDRLINAKHILVTWTTYAVAWSMDSMSAIHGQPNPDYGTILPKIAPDSLIRMVGGSIQMLCRRMHSNNPGEIPLYARLMKKLWTYFNSINWGNLFSHIFVIMNNRSLYINNTYELS